MTLYNPPVPSPAQLAREAPALGWLPRPGGSGGDLPDINVWLALAVQEHPHHGAARRYRAEAQAAGVSALWFCRVTMLGLVRLLCQPRVVGAGALRLDGAWALYEQFRAVPGVGLLAEPDDCDTHLRALVSATDLPARLWTDAYLAALAQSSGLRLVTFDADFQRFALPQCMVLTTT